jgi:hypothetical protein
MLSSWKAMRDDMKNRSFEYCQHTLMLYKAKDRHDLDFWTLQDVPTNMSLVVFTSTLPGASHRNGLVVLGSGDTRIAFDYRAGSGFKALHAPPQPVMQLPPQVLTLAPTNQDDKECRKLPTPMDLGVLPKAGVIACVGGSDSGRTTLVGELLTTLQGRSNYFVLVGEVAKSLFVGPDKTVLRFPNHWGDTEMWSLCTSLCRILDHQRQLTHRDTIVIILDRVSFPLTDDVFHQMILEASELDIVFIFMSQCVGFNLNQPLCDKIDILFVEPSLVEREVSPRLHTSFFSKHYSVEQFEKMVETAFTGEEAHKFLVYARSSDTIHIALARPKTDNLFLELQKWLK